MLNILSFFTDVSNFTGYWQLDTSKMPSRLLKKYKAYNRCRIAIYAGFLLALIHLRLITIPIAIGLIWWGHSECKTISEKDKQDFLKFKKPDQKI